MMVYKTLHELEPSYISLTSESCLFRSQLSALQPVGGLHRALIWQLRALDFNSECLRSLLFVQFNGGTVFQITFERETKSTLNSRLKSQDQPVPDFS